MNSWKDIPNPWQKLPAGKFCLGGEENENYQQTIPPQPYQGTPEAKIWVLLANPGYEENDDTTGQRTIYGDKSLFRNPVNQERCIDQLSFKKTGAFCNYVLNNEFNNYYGRDWFFEHFTGKDRLLSNEKESEFKRQVPKNPSENDLLYKIDRRFFLLQVHGYASKEYNGPGYFPHMEYNKALLQWAIDNGKIIVVARCADYWIRQIGELTIRRYNSKHFFFMRSRRVYFTRGNLFRYNDWINSQNHLEREPDIDSKVEEQLNDIYFGER